MRGHTSIHDAPAPIANFSTDAQTNSPQFAACQVLWLRDFFRITCCLHNLIWEKMKKKIGWLRRSIAFILLSIISLAQTSPTAPTEKVDAAAIDAIGSKPAVNMTRSGQSSSKRCAKARMIPLLGPSKISNARMVSRRQIWNLHSLGRVFGSRIRQRMVSRKVCTFRDCGIQASRSLPTGRKAIRIQRFHSHIHSAAFRRSSWLSKIFRGSVPNTWCRRSEHHERLRCTTPTFRLDGSKNGP